MPTDEAIARLICEAKHLNPDDVYNPGDAYVGKWPTHACWEQEIRWGHVTMMRKLFADEDACDCENAEPEDGVALVSEACPIHGSAAE